MSNITSAAEKFDYYKTRFFLDDEDYRGILKTADYYGLDYDLEDCRSLYQTWRKAQWFADLATKIREHIRNNIEITSETVIRIDISYGVWVLFYARKDQAGYYMSRPWAEFWTKDMKTGEKEAYFLSETESKGLWNFFELEYYGMD